jgi:hypothetical protein
LTQNYLCFNATLTRTKEQIPLKSISSVEKKKTLMIPNAIKITTIDGQTLVFTSFVSRDEAFDCILRLTGIAPPPEIQSASLRTSILGRSTRNPTPIKGEIHLRLQYSPTETSPVTVRVEVVEARNLSGKGSTGYSDPYAAVSFGKKTQKTKPVKKTLNPQFYETFYVDIPRDETFRPIRVTLWDYSFIGSPDYLGSVSILLASIPPGVPLDEWFPLQDEEGVTKSTTTTPTLASPKDETSKFNNKVKPLAATNATPDETSSTDAFPSSDLLAVLLGEKDEDDLIDWSQFTGDDFIRKKLEVLFKNQPGALVWMYQTLTWQRPRDMWIFCSIVVTFLMYFFFFFFLSFSLSFILFTHTRC